MATLYYMKKSFNVTETAWYLSRQMQSKAVIIPGDEDKYVLGIKDVCAAVRGISPSLEAVGFHRLAALECNPVMCENLVANGYPGVVQGDGLNDLDRATFHCTPAPVRCTLMSGFPCQPLSSQGDRKGQADERSKPFFGPGSTNARLYCWRMPRGPIRLTTSRRSCTSWLGVA